jgi:type I restriction enzyme S subunit
MKTGHTPSRSVPEYWLDAAIPWFTLADVWQLRDGRQVYVDDTTEKISESGLQHSAAESLPAGTVVLSRTASVGFSGIMRVPMATSQDFWNWVCGPELLPEYLNYQFKALAPELRSLNMGSTHQTIYQKDAAGVELIVPPIDEQKVITGFLDLELTKIDALIAKQEQLIATLREDRIATITHAVTKGLDPDVAMKATGLPWAGDIPRHWEFAPIKRVVRSVGVGLVINPSTYVADSGVPFLLGRNVRDGWVDLANVNYMSEEDSRRLEASRLKAGDVVVVRAGYPGRAAVISAELDGANCASILILRRPTLVQPEFLAAFFNSLLGRTQVKLAQYGAAQEQINVGNVVNFVMPVPPLSEQQEIAERISATAAAIDTLIDKANEVIDTLREYRSALITDAVTGKIDVRGAA